ncbi:MAG TPA: 16S rRNA (adenine(1518)-N(6)/adenine(1519)-N(6))-dimethyltransferase RsmA [Verrucomicrobiae bacterium]
MNLNEMKQVLAERGIQLTKSLGQNFLHDANQLRRIMAVAELKQTDRILEIGPGLGPLTEILIEQVGEVLAIEKDARLVEVLKQRFQTETGGTPVLRLLHDDALDYLKREARDLSGWKMVANLPFSVASPLLVELALSARGPQRMVGTLQVEVAKRLHAEPGAPDYGVLTLLVQLNYEPQPWFKIPPSCFFPEPDVDSACVCLVRREPPPLTNDQRRVFVRLVKRGFSQRRKMMLKLLKQEWPQPRLAQEFERLNLSPQIRAEKVSLDQFIQLARNLSEAPSV